MVQCFMDMVGSDRVDGWGAIASITAGLGVTVGAVQAVSSNGQSRVRRFINGAYISKLGISL